MNRELQDLFYKAEKNYLQSSEIEKFQGHITQLKTRLATYKIIRDKEISIFQSVVDQLQINYLDIAPDILEKVLKHWLAIMRYAAMAMLMNNPEFLQHRILEWLTPQIKAHQIEAVESKFYQTLITELKNHLSEDQFNLIEPFLEQSKITLIGAESNQKVPVK